MDHSLPSGVFIARSSPVPPVYFQMYLLFKHCEFPDFLSFCSDTASNICDIPVLEMMRLIIVWFLLSCQCKNGAQRLPSGDHI